MHELIRWGWLEKVEEERSDVHELMASAAACGRPAARRQHLTVAGVVISWGGTAGPRRQQQQCAVVVYTYPQPSTHLPCPPPAAA